MRAHDSIVLNKEEAYKRGQGGGGGQVEFELLAAVREVVAGSAVLTGGVDRGGRLQGRQSGDFGVCLCSNRYS